jgi:hypothetical protein
MWNGREKQRAKKSKGREKFGMQIKRDGAKKKRWGCRKKGKKKMGCRRDAEKEMGRPNKGRDGKQKKRGRTLKKEM